jgi:hypothetical protein
MEAKLVFTDGHSMNEEETIVPEEHAGKAIAVHTL